MLSLTELLVRFGIALAIGLVIGLERESIGKDAGVRTSMLVCGGSALFTLAGLSLPYFISFDMQNLTDVIARNSGFLMVIANIVVGVGFLGAGIIMKQENHVHGLTTAALIWTTAAVGILIGMGMIWFGVIAGILLAILLFTLRGLRMPHNGDGENK